MKKLILLSTILLFITTANAQWGNGKKIKGNGKVITKDRKTEDYNKISVAGSLDVVLVSGTEGNITIKGEENLIEYIITEVKKGKLKIKVEDGYSLKSSNGKTILITVPFQDIEAVSLAGSGDVSSKSTIKASDFKTSLAGSGDLNLTVDASKVKASVAGSGDLQLKGKTQTFKCSVAGSGNVHAFDLKANTVDVSVSGSGDAKVYCNDELNASIVGSGDVKYKGNPAKQDTKVIGSGDIEKE